MTIVSSTILFVTLILFSLHPTSRLRPACSVDGTSAAAPTVAGLVALINAHRAKRGRPALGFANPLLYQAWTCVRVCVHGDGGRVAAREYQCEWCLCAGENRVEYEC